MAVPVRAGADLRLLRASVFSAVCVALSAIGHAGASGAGIPLWALAAGWVGVLCAVGPLAGRERSLPGIAAVLLAGELGLHLVFCLGQGWVSAAPVGPSDGVPSGIDPAKAMAGMPGMHGLTGMSGMHGLTGMSGMHGLTGMPGMPDHGGHAMTLTAMFTPAMLVAHLAVAVIVGWMLRRGEAALWQLVRLYAVVAEHLAVLLPLARLLAAARVLALVVGLLERRWSAARRYRVEYPAGRLRFVALRHCVIRRGPPAVA